MEVDIKSIGQRMSTQDNIGSQYPIWVVAVEKKNYVGYEMSWDGKERAIKDWTDPEEYAKSLCDDCAELYDDRDGYDKLPEECPDDMCDYDSYWYYEIDPNYPDLKSGAFLTQAACQDHIDENYYHYKEPHTYAWTAWRNPEMVSVMQHIIKESGNDLPSHYQ